jgi:CheY-like chemotaxis protein
VITRALTDAGAECFQAENGLKALELLDEEEEEEEVDATTCTKFDILCSDILMPHLSGLQLVERLRRQRRYDELRCIAFTGAASAEEVATYVAAGFHAVVQKQCRLPSIVNTVAEQLALLLQARGNTKMCKRNKKGINHEPRMSPAPAPAAPSDNNEEEGAFASSPRSMPARRQLFVDDTTAPLRRTSSSASSISSPPTTTLRRIEPRSRFFSVTPILTPRIDTRDLKSNSAGPLTTASRSFFTANSPNNNANNTTDDFEDDGADAADDDRRLRRASSHLRQQHRFQQREAPSSPGR